MVKCSDSSHKSAILSLLRSLSFIRDKGNESGGFHLNSRVVGSLVTTRFENKTFDVVVTLQHVKVCGHEK